QTRSALFQKMPPRLRFEGFLFELVEEVLHFLVYLLPVAKSRISVLFGYQH
ncbi:MAG: hypothetical protein ACJAVW_002268, partial [Spirosomataceae bacterium]